MNDIVYLQSIKANKIYSVKKRYQGEFMNIDQGYYKIAIENA